MDLAAECETRLDSASPVSYNAAEESLIILRRGRQVAISYNTSTIMLSLSLYR